MDFYTLYKKLHDAFEDSTPNNNFFKIAIKSIEWDNKVIIDGEYYFMKDGHLFTTPSLDPFDINKCWRPELTPNDLSGTIIF